MGLAKQRRLLVVVAACVLVCLILVLVTWLSLKSADERDFSNAKNRLDQARAVRQYDIAIETMDGYLNGGWYRQHKYEAYIYVGTLYEMKDDYQKALEAYRSAEQYNPGGRQAEFEAIARVSEKLGDTKTALTYYEKALAAMDDGGVSDREDAAWLKKKIDKLKATQ